MDYESFEVLAHKNFSGENLKKIKWVRKMFAEWREVCNFEHCHDDYINCDLEDMSTITVDSLVSGMRRFITEIRKMDGNDFPPKTLYQIVLCVQFHLETKGITW